MQHIEVNDKSAICEIAQFVNNRNGTLNMSPNDMPTALSLMKSFLVSVLNPYLCSIEKFS